MLNIRTERLGNMTVLYLVGKIVRGQTEVLRKAVLAETDANILVLDLAHVNTVDAGGLGLLLELRQHSDSKGTEFRLSHVTRLVKKILEITKLDSVFELSSNHETPTFLYGGSQILHAKDCWA